MFRSAMYCRIWMWNIYEAPLAMEREKLADVVLESLRMGKKGESRSS